MSGLRWAAQAVPGPKLLGHLSMPGYPDLVACQAPASPSGPTEAPFASSRSRVTQMWRCLRLFRAGDFRLRQENQACMGTGRSEGSTGRGSPLWRGSPQ